jgi:hypothetical protein
MTELAGGNCISDGASSSRVSTRESPSPAKLIGPPPSGCPAVLSCRRDVRRAPGRHGGAAGRVLVTPELFPKYGTFSGPDLFMHTVVGRCSLIG